MIKIVKTWCENTQEGENYLKHVNYGSIVRRILLTNYYICIGGQTIHKVSDVKIILGGK